MDFMGALQTLGQLFLLPQGRATLWAGAFKEEGVWEENLRLHADCNRLMHLEAKDISTQVIPPGSAWQRPERIRLSFWARQARPLADNSGLTCIPDIFSGGSGDRISQEGHVTWYHETW